MPDTLKCAGNNLLKCVEDGSRFEVLKECAEGSPCQGDPPDCKAKGGEDTVAACTTAAECVQQLGNIGSCREASCSEGKCKVEIAGDGAVCDDGTVCTESDACLAGVCVGVEVGCDDKNPCTADSCDPAEGCGSVPVGEEPVVFCDDGNPCTKNDKCNGEVCGGVELDCNDKNQCTDDLCDAATGKCVNLAKSGPCDDGNLCTENDKCVAGKCVGTKKCPCKVDKDCDIYGSGDPCEAKLICENEWCEPAAGTGYQCSQLGLGPCVFAQCFDDGGKPGCQELAAADGSPCDDGDICTKEDVCVGGICSGSVDLEETGCSLFRLKWGVLLPASNGGSPDGQVLHTSTGAPVIWGTALNEEFDLKVRAVGPGL